MNNRKSSKYSNASKMSPIDATTITSNIIDIDAMMLHIDDQQADWRQQLEVIEVDVPERFSKSIMDTEEEKYWKQSDTSIHGV